MLIGTGVLYYCHQVSTQMQLTKYIDKLRLYIYRERERERERKRERERERALRE
jgi:hypothetical protein